MPKLQFDRQVPFSPRQMFDLVADLKAYPQFVPNCTNMQITGAPPLCDARMRITFGPVSEAYTSRVTLDTENFAITADAIDGPFSHLHSAWHFDERSEGTHVHFEVDFGFANKLIALVADPAFAAKQEEIVDAFVSEAKRRYA